MKEYKHYNQRWRRDGITTDDHPFQITIFPKYEDDMLVGYTWWAKKSNFSRFSDDIFPSAERARDDIEQRLKLTTQGSMT